MKKSLIIVLALVLVFAFSATALAAAGDTAGEAYTSLNASGGFNPTLDVDLAGATASGSAYLYSAAGAHDLSVEAVAGQSGDVVVVDGFGANIGSSATTSATTDNPATANMNFSLGAQTLYYTINFHVTRDTVTKYYSISNHFSVYVGNSNTDLGTVTLDPNDANEASSVELSGSNAYGHVDLATTSVAITAAKGNALQQSVVISSPTLTFAASDESKSTTITVTAENGQTEVYTLNVYRDWNDTSFKLTTGSGSSLKTYTPDGDGDIDFVFPYASIEEGDSITFTPVYAAGGSYEAEPRSSDDDSISVSDRETSLKIEFEEDPDSTYRVEITVTAPNGDDEEEYTLYLEEADPVFLDDLDIMIGSTSSTKDLDYTMLPSSFDEETFAYYVFVPWDDSSAYDDGVGVYLKASFDDDDYTVECGSTALSDGSYKKVGDVADGEDDVFTVTITDEDDNSQDYKVYVFYGEDDADDDASLKDLYVKYGSSYKTTATLSPSFSKSTYSYTASLPLGTKSAKVTLKLNDSDAIIICDGEQVGSTVTFSNLKTGANTFKFVVMAEDYDTTKTYTVTLNVGSGGLLTNLVFTPISGSFTVSPSFSGDVYNYVANVSNSVSAIYVTPTAIDSSYTISVYKGASDYKTVTSGKTSSAITLNEGLNEIKVYVYKSGSSKTYTLNIFRQPAATKYQVSSQKITINGVSKSLYAVNINGNNFLKLRDLAYMLSGTTKQFNVTYSLSANTAAITGLTAYVNDPSNPVNQPIVLSNPQLSSQRVTLDGKSAYPVAYNVAGSNYVNLRQVCAMLDIGLTYNAASNSISITTANSYTPGL